MRFIALALGVLVCAACQQNPEQPDRAASAASGASTGTAASAGRRAGEVFPIAITNGRFVKPSGDPFVWRGVTAFRLAEMIAHGREQEAAAYLDWAASQQLTVVRVLIMARHLFQLTPEEGRAALPRLLDLARARAIAVEVVAFADTNDVTVDYDAHVREVGRIASEKGNALIEIANEPGHHTQDPRLHDPAFARRLAALLPQPLLVALGSFEYGDEFASDDYATWHVPRESSDEGWGHVLALAARPEWVKSLNKPVVSDEPIGAGAAFEPGKRDDDPDRFRAAAVISRMAGLGATFHYEGGLYARTPSAREAECLNAWLQAWRLLPQDIEHTGVFRRSGDAAAVVRDFDRARALAVFERQDGDHAWIAVLRPAAGVDLQLQTGWSVISVVRTGGVQIVEAQRHR